MPQSYDFGPLFGSTVGFDRVFDLLQSATRGQQEADRYPPYDIERTGGCVGFSAAVYAKRFGAAGTRPA
jgi:HSP20 family molecular chaperone IbpA